MTARRASAKPDGDATLLPAWKQAYASLSGLTTTNSITESINRANKDMQQFQKDYILPEQTAVGLKPIKVRIKKEISDIRDHSQNQIDACEKALDQIGNIIKLKEAQEAFNASSEKRSKRLRESSATNAPLNGVNPGTANGGPNRPYQHIFQQIQARTQRQLPLKAGRKVAFRVPKEDGKPLPSPPIPDGTSYEEAGWILATVRQPGPGDKYMVQDVEGENGQEPPTYEASLSWIIPLPIANVLPSDPSHLNAYTEYESKSTVLALYPETTSFYKAEVVASPKELLAAGARAAPVATRAAPSYKLRFDEDDGQVRLISAEEVIDFPGY